MTHLSLDEIGCYDSAKAKKMGSQPTMMFSKKRIDYLFYSAGIQIENFEIIHVKMSDHYPLLATFQLHSFK